MRTALENGGEMAEELEQGDPFLTVTQVADLLQVCTKTVRTWIKDEKLDAIKIGGKGYRIKFSSIDDLIPYLKPQKNKRKQNGKTQAPAKGSSNIR